MINRQEKIKRISQALEILKTHETHCQLCPRNCGVNRAQGEKGYCGESLVVRVGYIGPHFGEEPVISGIIDYQQSKENKLAGGSGTIFFSGCNLKCVYCQNFQLSWLNQGEPLEESALAQRMIDLQDQGVLNINLVTASHFLIPVLRALRLAYQEGLNIPLVYNSGGYEKKEIIAVLDQIVDVYLPDLKYSNPSLSQKLSAAPDYFQFASAALLEMKKQQPELLVDERNIARKGLICRHLVLPGQVENSQKIISWTASHLGKSIGFSLMSQYRPCFKAPSTFNRFLCTEEYQQVLKWAKDIKWDILFIQPTAFSQDEHLIPDFNSPDPFGWQK